LGTNSQPLITGSVLTFEHEENNRRLGYDKVMQAGGIGYGKAQQSIKHKPSEGDKIVILGGENYRIGMGGAAVSSADTGAFSSGIELNAIQRRTPKCRNAQPTPSADLSKPTSTRLSRSTTTARADT
jgi:phosphoribosylformylglycinamidine synthase